MEELKKLLEDLQKHFDGVTADTRKLLEAQGEEIKKQGASSADTAKALEEKGKQFDQAVADMAALKERMDAMEAEAKRLPQPGGEPEEQSIGQQFVDSEAYKQFNPGTGKVSDAIQLKSFFPRQRKAGELTGASLGNTAAYLYPTQRVPGIIVAPELQPRVRDLFTVLPTSSGAIQFIRETGFTNAAAATAETVAKPQSALTFEEVAVTVSTIAHWLPVTRQILADAAGLQNYIDTRLLYGLMLTEDNELLYGTGSGAHLTGLLTDADIQTLTQASGDNKADAVRRAITLVSNAGYPANGVILHPNDWEDIELMKDSNDRYIWVDITVGGQRRLWKLPVVETQAVTEGTFATGAFNLAASIWDREDARVRVSDQHEDYFTKNLVALLAEERLALTVYRPEAIVLGTFTAAGS